jgi:CubicO group peptidase (beta-lactamase class C family)
VKATATLSVVAPRVATVTLEFASSSLGVGQTLQAVATTRDETGAVLTGRAVTYASSSPTIATISETGLLTAVTAGTVIIQAISDGQSALATVTVLAPVASIVISPVPTAVVVGKTVQLVATFLDSRGATLTSRLATWNTSNAETATVDVHTGLVTGIAVGTATMTVAAEGKVGISTLTVVPLIVTPFTRILDSVRVANDLPAMAAAIVTRSGAIALDAVGFRRYGGSVPVTKTDQFHLGSDLKSMTAGLIGLLIDQGKVKWTSTLAEIFPELVSSMRAEYRNLTVRELLSQQSGLVHDPSVAFTDPTPMQQRARFVQWVVQEPPASARGTYSYSNSNYILAGAIAERLLDIPFEQAIVDQLLLPLGITTVGWGAAGTPGHEDQPWQHYFDMNGVRVLVSPGPTADNPPVYGPAGRAHMSIGDWALWIQAVLDADVGQPSPWAGSTARALTSPAVTISGVDGYAFGWVATHRSWAGTTGRVLTHEGSNSMNEAVAWLAPDAGFGIIIVTNQAGAVATRAVDELFSRLLTFYQMGR